MSNGGLLNALCPSPEEWAAMETKEFQERVGKCLGYLLYRDQQRLVVSSISSFIGGLVGGAVTMLAYLGFK